MNAQMNNIYKQHVSVFENFHSMPMPLKLGQWLKVCKNGCRYADKVLLYRQTKEAKLKKSLPIVTVGAVCKGGRKLKNIETRTGWIALDIDSKDNPHLTDAVHLRDEVAKIANVAFSGLSTGGAGVWALVKVAHPELQSEHFIELIKDFQHFGIVLDSSKGRNPNDARFYSFDPGAVIKDVFTIYKKLPSKVENNYQPKTKIQLSNDYSRYVETAFKNELSILSCTQPGNRNNQLFKSTASLAGFVAGEMLTEHDVKEALLDTALAIGLKHSEIISTLNSGFDAGLKTPRYPHSLNQNSVKVKIAPQVDSVVNGKYESRNLTPNSLNPFTGDLIDERGYPAEWDEVLSLLPGTIEFSESTYYMEQDGDQNFGMIGGRYKDEPFVGHRIQ